MTDHDQPLLDLMHERRQSRNLRTANTWLCVALASTRSIARRPDITQHWFRAFGYAVWDCPWPDGLWSRP